MNAAAPCSSHPYFIYIYIYIYIVITSAKAGFHFMHSLHQSPWSLGVSTQGAAHACLRLSSCIMCSIRYSLRVAMRGYVEKENYSRCRTWLADVQTRIVWLRNELHYRIPLAKDKVPCCAINWMAAQTKHATETLKSKKKHKWKLKLSAD